MFPKLAYILVPSGIALLILTYAICHICQIFNLQPDRYAWSALVWSDSGPIDLLRSLEVENDLKTLHKWKKYLLEVFLKRSFWSVEFEYFPRFSRISHFFRTRPRPVMFQNVKTQKLQHLIRHLSYSISIILNYIFFVEYSARKSNSSFSQKTFFFYFFVTIQKWKEN